MILWRLNRILCLGALTVAIGCGGGRGGGPTDIGPAADSSVADAGRDDAAPVGDVPTADAAAVPDAEPDAGPAADAAIDSGVRDAGDAGPADSGVPPPPACVPGALIDLNRAGTKTASTTTYIGSNDSAPATSNIQAPSCSAFVGHQVVFSYVPYSTTRLKISTNYTDTSTDTVVWALDRCASSMAVELGCNDDAFVPPSPKASTFATEVVQRGAPINIVVAGFRRDHGTFHLTVKELSAVVTGGRCDLSGIEDYCSAGVHCIGASSPGTCVNDGSSGGVCRDSGAACDPNFACNGMPGDYGARCVPLLGVGAQCDPTGHDNQCASPNQCSVTSRPPVCVVAPYSEAALASPVFIDACASGSRVTSLVSSTGAAPRDDGHSAAPLTIPFSFQFFGMAQTMIWPDTNGYAVFGSTPPRDLVGGPASVPEMNEGPLVAPLFEDLILPPSPAGDLCYVTVGAAPNRQMVIEWLGAYPYGASMPSSARLTFEVVLSETTNTVDFIYQRLDAASADVAYANGMQAAVEIQAAGGTSYAAHRGTVATGQGFRFSPR